MAVEHAQLTINPEYARAGRRTADPDQFPIVAKASLSYRLVRLLTKPVFSLLLRVRVSGLEHLPAGNYLAISNHLQGLDGPIIGAKLPANPRLHAVGDPDAIMGHRVKWWFVKRVGGLIPVDRGVHGDERFRTRVRDALDLGCAVLIFPEGKTGPQEGALLPFKKGFAHFALQTNTPVVPMALTGTRSQWFFKRIDLKIGPAIDPAGHTADSLTAAGRDAVGALLVPEARRRGPKIFNKRAVGGSQPSYVPALG